MQIAKFTEEKLKELLHYTDESNNPSYDAFKSNAFYKIYSGAKGVSKSFGRMIETIYRFVNEKNFCSVWCRNQFNHIKTTLKPMLEKVLAFLAEEHNLDYREYIYITNEAAYWKFDDGGLDRAIYFQNWEKIQGFQGFTLKSPKFRFGELVIDEPLEDVADTNKLPHELLELYQKQQEKLPLLIQNTVLREIAPDGFNVNVTFLYNIFTLDHFLITDYHNKVIDIVDFEGNPNKEVLQTLLEQNYIQKESKEYSDGLGLIVTMFSKFFVPKSTISEIQIKNLSLLKSQNYRLWVITVVGFAFNFVSPKTNYFMKPILFDETNQLYKDRIKFVSTKYFIKVLKEGKVIGLYHGYDPGIHDNAAFVTTALLKSGEIIIVKVIDDIKQGISKAFYINKAINNKVAYTIKTINEIVEKNVPNFWIEDNFIYGKTSILFSDNNASIEALNILFQENKISCKAIPAIRKPSQAFGIVDRQMWQKFIFENKLIKFMPNTTQLIKNLAKQAIATDEEKRDESIHPEIYDSINAFEMSCSLVFKYQYKLIYDEGNK